MVKEHKVEDANNCCTLSLWKQWKEQVPCWRAVAFKSDLSIFWKRVPGKLNGPFLIFNLIVLERLSMFCIRGTPYC